jgi:hypothetical protein
MPGSANCTRGGEVRSQSPKPQDISRTYAAWTGSGALPEGRDRTSVGCEKDGAALRVNCATDLEKKRVRTRPAAGGRWIRTIGPSRCGSTLTAAVSRIEKHGGRRIVATKGPVIPDIGPQPPGHGLVFGEHRHSRIVTVDPVGGHDMTADQVDKRCQCGAACPHPVGQGRHVKLDAFTGTDVTLPTFIIPTT